MLPVVLSWIRAACSESIVAMSLPVWVVESNSVAPTKVVIADKVGEPTVVAQTTVCQFVVSVLSLNWTYWKTTSPSLKRPASPVTERVKDN